MKIATAYGFQQWLIAATQLCLQELIPAINPGWWSSWEWVLILTLKSKLLKFEREFS